VEAIFFLTEHVIIPPMLSFSQKRRRAISLKMSELGKQSQRVQSARRLALIDPEDVADRLANPPPEFGDSIGSLEWRNFQTGKVTRWTVLRGNRCNNYALRTPDGRESKPHGLAWLLAKVRHVILCRI